MAAADASFAALSEYGIQHLESTVGVARVARGANRSGTQD